MKTRYWVGFVILIGALTVMFVADYAQRPPITTTFRQSKMYKDGLVLQVHNTGSGYLCCLMTAVNRQRGQTASLKFELGPKSTKEIGVLEADWSFVTGEKVRINVEGYGKDVTLSVPK